MTALLEIRDLHLGMKSFEGEAHVLNGVDLTVERGQIWGVVGETGCGKSLTGLSISRLVSAPPARYMKGRILFEGKDVLAASEEEMRKLRGRRIGMIFQDPTTNLNPSFRIGEQMIDVALHAAEEDPSILGLDKSASGARRRAAARKLAAELLDSVGIPDAANRLDSYPHEFSGGMRQRVLIALALIGRPDLLIADEPTTALDVSVQAQVLRIFYDLVRRHNLAVILITHNLGVVAQLCSHVAVMYAGNIIEQGSVDAVLSQPRHPYTRALLAAVPGAKMKRGALAALGGSVPNLLRPPHGCRFAPRCAQAAPRCEQRFPPMIEVGARQSVACTLYEETARAAE
ncbi:ABC transporter ATP-binding protein [Terrarubrum flagellatum]|uniref:ABC transporter ATP-binding protein n=1 Tax=Terrirubrum flagellatum TaxID=2895980 RepID=UPI00314500ED